MSFPFYKPLMPPKPRRRDRRGARRTERLHEVMLWPDRSELSTRELASKRAAFARFQARYAPDERMMLLPMVILGLVVVVSILAALEFRQSRHLVLYESAQARYEQLVVQAATSCRVDMCEYGWFDEPPTPEVKRLMSDVRSRRVVYDSWTATTIIRGSHNASFRLVHESPFTTSEQARARVFANQQASEQRSRAELNGWRSRLPVREALGNGWFLVRSP